jgi:hypothetical protein
VRFLQSILPRFASILLVAASLLAQAEIYPPVGSLLPPPIQPLPAVVELAGAQRIPLVGIDAPCSVQKLRAGDEVTLLFTLCEAGRVQQWLAEIKVAVLSDKERQIKPSDTTIYSSSGNEFHLASSPATFALRMFGPFFDSDARRTRISATGEKDARFNVKEDYLGFGFDHMCEMALRLRLTGREICMGFTTGPFPQDQIAWGKKWVQEAGFTRDDELVCAKQAFATVEFLSVAQHTPGLQDIVRATVQMPSVWTGLWKMKFGLFFSYDWKHLVLLDGTAQGMTAPVYSLPFGLTAFGCHVADGTWFVTAAHPPLLACAGVIGLTVMPPDEKDKRLEIRVIAARNALR